MKKTIKNFIPKLIFSLFFVYVLLLGVMNLTVVKNRETIEKLLAGILEAQKVTIGSISNLPLVFISGTEFEVIVHDELSFKVEGIYVHYRFWNLFTKEYERIPSRLQVDKIIFNGHSTSISAYKKLLTKKFKKYGKKEESSTILGAKNPQEIIDNIDFNIDIKDISFVVNSMTEFWHKFYAKRIDVSLKENILTWKANVGANSIWSNNVFLYSADLTTEGVLTNFSDGKSKVSIRDLNMIGIPIVKENINLSINLSNKIPSVQMLGYKQKDISIQTKDPFALSINRSLKIAYEDFEEYNMIDYAFAPGRWDFNLDLKYTDDWRLKLSFLSVDHPDHGLTLNLNPIRKKLYEVNISLITHYFGSIVGDLLLPVRPGLYPLPSGSLTLENVRFILSGLIFSGHAIVDAVPNKNELDISAFDVKMNGGLIGSTSTKFEFTPEGLFKIYPRPLFNKAIDVTAVIGGGTFVQLDAYDVDGDFVAENIKIPLFGLKDSRYRGGITITKKSRKDPLYLNGSLTGYLDGEEQINASLTLVDTFMNIEQLYFHDQDLFFDGTVEIISKRSNTYIDIKSEATFRNNDSIPVHVGIDVGKYEVVVTGLVDEQIPFKTLTKGDITEFDMNFQNWSLQKLGVSGSINAQLLMGFSTKGVTRFSIQEAIWDVANRNIMLDFDTILDEETGMLNTTRMHLGVDREILKGYGSLSFMDDQFTGSIRFNRGGTFQFNIGRYIVKSFVDLKSITIDNIFLYPPLDSLSLLHGVETETVLADIKLDMVGPWSNLVMNGSANIEGADTTTFQLAVPQFLKKDDIVALTNLRMRHPLYNLDGNAFLQSKQEELYMDVSGAFALENVIKSEFALNYSKISNVGNINYDIPNLYFLSKKPTSMSGKIIHNENEYLFTSDSSVNGIVGSLMRNNNTNFWDITLLNKSLKLQSEGEISEQDILAALDLNLDLNRVSLSGDVRRARGKVRLGATVDGSVDEPVFNGNLDLEDIELSLRSLQNKFFVRDTQTVFISNNRFIFPDLTIDAQGGGNFGLDGVIALQNQEDGENIDIRLYSKNEDPKEFSYLNWNLEIPYLFVKGKTYINDIALVTEGNSLLLKTHITTDNLQVGLEFDDALGEFGESITTVNPLLALVSLLDLDIRIDVDNRFRFFNQLFNLDFKQSTPIKIQGNVGDDTVLVTGDLDIEKGKITYLNTDLKVVSGTLQFSGEDGDPFPFIALNTESAQRTLQNEQVDLYVDFEGKLPNIELARISSAPSKPRSELFALLGGIGGNVDSSSAGGGSVATSAYDLVAGGVGVAENTFFTAPLARRIQRLVPFIDTIELKTDVLGNLTRAATDGTGAVVGLSILHGSEIGVAQYLPGITGLQVKYNLRFESPNNTSLNTGDLNYIHRVGVEWSRPLPYGIQLGLGVDIELEVEPGALIPPSPEPIFEANLRKRF